MNKLVEVQTMRQNSANWKYNIRDDKELINVSHVIRVKPYDCVYKVYVVGGDLNYPIIIDGESYKKIFEKIQE